MSGTRITVEDVETGASYTEVVVDDFVVICDGKCMIFDTYTSSNGLTYVVLQGRDITPIKQITLVPGKKDE